MDMNMTCATQSGTGDYVLIYAGTVETLLPMLTEFSASPVNHLVQDHRTIWVRTDNIFCFLPFIPFFNLV